MVETSEENKRRFRRARTFFTGVITDKGQLTDVVVADISANGAKVRVKGEVPEADNFKLRVNGVGEFEATVCFREGVTLGVRFDEGAEEVAKAFRGRLKGLYPAS